MSAKAIIPTVVLTLLGFGRGSAAAWQDAPPAPPPPLSAVPYEEPADAVQRPPTVLLLTNGHVFRGEIREDSTGYYLRHKIGVKQFARRNVAGVFSSLDEAYRFQLARIPRNDPDERMKLALWCMEQKLPEQARQELDTVLALSPDNKRAKAMVFHLDSTQAKPMDPSVARASAVGNFDAADSVPRELSSTALDQLREAQNQRPPAGPPIIFDLPAALAVRRYQEFTRFVHPELQNHCARCHDVETYQGAFRLYRTRTRRDLTNDLVTRVNLDAALQLVDPTDLSRSKLLTSSAMSHPPDGRPVLGGPNHPSYRVFATWVSSLRDATTQPATTPSGVVPVGFERSPVPPVASGLDAQAESFAAGRNADAVSMAPRPGPTLPATPPDNLDGIPITATPRIVGGGTVQGSVTAPSVPRNAEFPTQTGLPASGLSDRMPSLPSVSASTATSVPPTGRVQPPAAPMTTPAPPGQAVMPDGTPAIRLPSGELIPFVSSEALRKTPIKGEQDPAKQAVQAGERKAKIDRSALQNYLEKKVK